MSASPKTSERGHGSVLVVDDNPAMGKVLVALLDQLGLRAEHVSSGMAALATLTARPFDLVVADYRMAGMDGLELVRRVAERWPEIPVIVLTAHGTIPLAVDAMKAGATDFLLKTFEHDEIAYVIRKALTKVDYERKRPRRTAINSHLLIGECRPMREVLHMVRKAAQSDATVLIRGETGTGKEMIARTIHEQSARRSMPMVTLHCAAFPDALLEAELFGYEKGAFTGAASRKPGRIELGQGGTVFLDEIGDITPAVQVKLLRLLQGREFERLGGGRTIRVDVRFVAATHRDLERMIARGEFREDLFYRLNVLPIWLPPLRERSADVAALAHRFCSVHAARNNKAGMGLAPGAIELLEQQPWPGNVRELENFIERVVVMSDERWIAKEDIERELQRHSRLSDAAAPGEPPAGSQELVPLHAQVRSTERDAIVRALRESGNNRALAARILGVSRSTLYLRLEEFGLI